ncbi:MAG: response regulator [Acidobacteriota bacterium]
MQHRILLVDDEPSVTSALKRSLRREPYDILEARSAPEALKILAHGPVDVVISDEQMPEMSGSEFLARVCRDHPDTVRIILTGQATVEAILRAVNQGEIYRFLTKPCNETDLKVTLRQALRQKELLSRCRQLLRTAQKQASLLEDLEKHHPGLTQVATDSDGVTIVLEDPGLDASEVIRECEREVQACEDLLAPASDSEIRS